MDASFRTPLVDCFRRGEVTRDVRLLAARGALAPRAHEQLILLVLLVADPDEAVAATAEATIARIPAEALAAFLARSDVSADLREFFGERGVAPAGAPGGDIDGPLLSDADGAEESSPQSGQPDGAAGPEPAEPQTRQGTAQRLAALSVAERVKVAMQGSREERSILIRDPNRLVSAAVLSSPKLSESEVEAIARMGNVSDDVLRIVGTTRAWIKNYNVIAALARNAKTPVAVGLHLLPRLVERDLKLLSTDRNVSEPIRMAARRMCMQGEARRK